MAPDGKALLARGKALADSTSTAYDQAMLSTSQRMAEKLKTALAARGLSQKEFAERCGASKQAVQGWIKTGRVDKKHLPKFVEVLKYPLEWWLDGTIAAPSTKKSQITEPEPAYTLHWPFSNISRAEYETLNDHQKGMVEGFIKGLLKPAAPAKSNGTTGT